MRAQAAKTHMLRARAFAVKRRTFGSCHLGQSAAVGAAAVVCLVLSRVSEEEDDDGNDGDEDDDDGAAVLKMTVARDRKLVARCRSSRCVSVLLV